jgi:hypothetical protein
MSSTCTMNMKRYTSLELLATMSENPPTGLPAALALA